MRYASRPLLVICTGTMILTMSFVEIELAARQLPADQKQQLLMRLAQSLRDEGQPLPEPRAFASEEMHAWMDEDERDMKQFRGQG